MLKLSVHSLVVIIIALTLVLGVETLLLIRTLVPSFLFNAAIVAFSAYLVLFLACIKRVRYAYLGNIMVAALMIFATFLSRGHFMLVAYGNTAATIVIVGGLVLNVLLITTSIIAYRRHS